jgi:hypothetical protein
MTTPSYLAMALNESAEKIRSAKDGAQREAALAEFRAICQAFELNPAMEAAGRNIAPLNQFQ